MVISRRRAVRDAGPREQIMAVCHDPQSATPLEICEVCVRLLPVTGAALVEMIDVNRLEQVCATDEMSCRLEALQFALGEGPYVQAVRTGSPVLVSDLREVRPTRWPMFAEAASRTPVRALYAFPLQVGAISVGVLGLYHNQPGALTAAEIAGALLGADLAREALLSLRASTNADVVGPDAVAPDREDLDIAVPQQRLAGTDLQQAEIHRATGMVMAQREISAESALATLRAFAYSNGQPLDGVARQVVNRQLRFR